MKTQLLMTAFIVGLFATQYSVAENNNQQTVYQFDSAQASFQEVGFNRFRSFRGHRGFRTHRFQRRFNRNHFGHQRGFYRNRHGYNHGHNRSRFNRFRRNYYY